MTELIRHATYYDLEANYLEKPKAEVIINKIEKALVCSACDLFDCPHIRIIWKMQEEAEYLESLGFINISFFKS